MIGAMTRKIRPSLTERGFFLAIFSGSSACKMNTFSFNLFRTSMAILLPSISKTLLSGSDFLLYGDISDLLSSSSNGWIESKIMLLMRVSELLEMAKKDLVADSLES